MSTRSKRLMVKKSVKGRSKDYNPYHYHPRQALVIRLALELKMTPNAVREQIAEERLYLLKQIYGEDKITRANV